MSFRLFFVIVILLMIVTGMVTLTDRWGASIEEKTGPDEQRSIQLATGIKINLGANSRLSFRKGALGKFVLQGEAEFNPEALLDGERISVETRDMIIKTKKANFKVNCDDGGTWISVSSGMVDAILKPDSKEIKHISNGEEFSYRIP